MLTKKSLANHRRQTMRYLWTSLIAVKKKGNSKPPKKFDTTMTKERKETLKRFFREKLPNAEADWKHLKSVLSDAAKHVFGKKEKTKSRLV